MLKQLSVNRFARHLLFWAGILLFFTIGFFTQPDVYNGDPVTFGPVPFLADLLFSSLISYLLYVYVLVYGLLPLAIRRLYGWFSIGLLGLNIINSSVYEVLSYVRMVLLHWSGLNSSPYVNIMEFKNPFTSPLFFESNLIAGLMVGIKLYSRWYQKEQESQRLEREKLQTELHLLKLQLDPAFLFNTLDTLQPLIQQQSEQAPEVILKLAHFLRYILYESQADRVPLGREISLIDNYIFLQKALHPTNLEVSFSVRGSVDYHSISPLSLFPIVENAFREVPTETASWQTDEPNWVSVDLSVGESLVSFKVVSESTHLPLQEGNRLTELASLQKQLTFHYPGQHQIEIWQEDRIKVVTLTIEFPTNSLTPVFEATTDTIA